ncbi:MAG: hypothetical protein O7G30_10715 [Proteobacteria bacterium]|nr:hypothetical protein [Pseudomonadota bacterium]
MIRALAGGALPALLVAAACAATAQSREPHVNYMLHCQGCHLPDGAGTEGQVPALQDTVGRFLAVPGGREFLVRVPGVAQAPLADADLAALLNWVVRQFGPAEIAADFVPFRGEEVARLRHSPLTDVATVRGELVQRIEAED